MAIIDYKDIDLKKSINTDNKIIEFNGSTIEIVPYLSINDKYQLVMATLAKANEGGVFNPVRLEMAYRLNLIYMYTNIVFTLEDRNDEISLYDKLYVSGLMSLIIDNIDSLELSILSQYLKDTEIKINQYNSGVSGLVDKVLLAIDEMPQKLEKVLETLKDINPELFSVILNRTSNNNSVN